MKRAKLPTLLAKNASKLHKRIGELLTSDDSPFKQYEIRQEYNVSKVNPDYHSNREKFDWVILSMNVAIEVHGQQHYEPICFGGMTIEEAQKIFKKRQEVDEEKRIAAQEALWAYVVVKYDEKDITLEQLVTRITEALRSVPEGIYEQKKKKVKIQSRGFDKPKEEYKWPKRKLQSRGFQKKIKEE